MNINQRRILNATDVNHLFKEQSGVFEEPLDIEDVARELIAYTMADIQWDFTALTDAEKRIVGSQSTLDLLKCWHDGRDW